MALALPVTKITPANIRGLSYTPNYITAEEENNLIQKIDAAAWDNSLKRRVQHYGYRYDYQAKFANENSALGALPSWLHRLCDQLKSDGIFSAAPNQIIVNEYQPGQGISAHIDCVPCFGETIASLSLGSSCIMALHQPTTREKHEYFLSPRSLMTLAEDARYVWQHSIPARKSDVWQGVKIPRGRRISLTFRNMIFVTES
jgi:alkylated DNA repair dioxygenase AlkB